MDACLEQFGVPPTSDDVQALPLTTKILANKNLDCLGKGS